MNSAKCLVLTLGLGLSTWVSTANAALILQPASASTDMGNGVGAMPEFVIDQSGLSHGYTSLVTDFDAYIASNPLYNMDIADSNWSSGFATLTGNFDFDLGGSFLIDRFALWNLGSDRVASVVGFSLLADDNPAFSSPVNLGSFNADPANHSGHASVIPVVVSFPPTTTAYLRMQITSNFGNSFTTGFGEAAVSVVPEPSAAGLCMIGIGGCLVRRIR